MRGGILYSPAASVYIRIDLSSRRCNLTGGWRPALLPSNFAARSSYFASAISRSLPATNSAVSTPMRCRQINGASLVISSAMPPKPHEDDFKCATLLLWLSTISASTNVIWHWNCFCSCHGKTDECDAGGGALKRAVDVRVFSPGLFR